MSASSLLAAAAGAPAVVPSAAASRKRPAPAADDDDDDDAHQGPAKKSKEPGYRAFCFTLWLTEADYDESNTCVLPLGEDGKIVVPTELCEVTPCPDVGDHAAKLKVPCVRYPLLEGSGNLVFRPLVKHDKMCYLTYQLERSSDNGKPHFQGYFETKTRQRLTAVIKLGFGNIEIRRGTQEQACQYTHKEFTRLCDGQPFEDGVLIRQSVSYKFDEVIKAIDAGEDVDSVDSPHRIEYCKKMHIFDTLLARRRKPSRAQCLASLAAPPLTHLRVWQQAIVDIVTAPPEPRLVYWITDRKGGRGKTSLSRHLVDEFGALSLGSSTEMSNAAYTWSTVHGQCRVVIFDISRAEGMQGQYSCTIMERLKDGLMNNTKYQSGMLRFPPPHVIVFSNFMPDVNRLSLDRWRIFELDDSEELIDVTEAVLAAAAAASVVYNAFPAMPAQNSQWPGFASS